VAVLIAILALQFVLDDALPREQRADGVLHCGFAEASGGRELEPCGRALRHQMLHYAFLDYR
jgi:hypothetical protein